MRLADPHRPRGRLRWSLFYRAGVTFSPGRSGTPKVISSLGATVNIPAGATGTIAGPANVKGVGSSELGVPGTINVSGSLALDNTSGSGGSINLSGGVSQGIIDVMPGGTLTATGTNNLFDSCCGAGVPTLENNGTIDVTSGQLFTQGVDLDQAGHLSVAAGALLDADAPTTLENSSTYTGGGEMLLDLSAVPTTLGGTISLGKGFHLNLGPQACMDGTGTITGKGSFDYTGGNLASGIIAQTAGSFQQGAPGTLGVTFAGTSPGTGFGQWASTGAVELAGKLLIGTSGGFKPPKSKPFAVLSYTSRSGKFATLSGSPAYTVGYHATSMDVTFR